MITSVIVWLALACLFPNKNKSVKIKELYKNQHLSTTAPHTGQTQLVSVSIIQAEQQSGHGWGTMLSENKSTLHSFMILQVSGYIGEDRKNPSNIQCTLLGL